MTRKKFKKKLMANGLSRNEVNKIVIQSRESGIPYQEYYDFECQWIKLRAAMRKVGYAFNNASKVMNLANQTMMSFGESMHVIANKMINKKAF
jgi:hypothetical protein